MRETQVYLDLREWCFSPANVKQPLTRYIILVHDETHSTRAQLNCKITADSSDVDEDASLLLAIYENPSRTPFMQIKLAKVIAPSPAPLLLLILHARAL